MRRAVTLSLSDCLIASKSLVASGAVVDYTATPVCGVAVLLAAAPCGSSVSLNSSGKALGIWRFTVWMTAGLWWLTESRLIRSETIGWQTSVVHLWPWTQVHHKRIVVPVCLGDNRLLVWTQSLGINFQLQQQ